MSVNLVNTLFSFPGHILSYKAIPSPNAHKELLGDKLFSGRSGSGWLMSIKCQVHLF